MKAGAVMSRHDRQSVEYKLAYSEAGKGMRQGKDEFLGAPDSGYSKTMDRLFGKPWYERERDESD